MVYIFDWQQQDDVNYIRLLQLQISVTEDLKHLFILLIRNYNPLMQSRQYLQDLIVTNHILLLIPDGISQTPDPQSHHNLMEHIQQYGQLQISFQIRTENYKVEFISVDLPPPKLCSNMAYCLRISRKIVST